MAFKYKQTLVAPSNTSIAALQTLSGAGSLTLNGTYAQTLIPNDGGTASFFAPNIQLWDNQVSGAFNVPVTLTSTNNLSGVTFTITGTQRQPYSETISVTETIAGPSGNTVTSVNFYNRILSIKANGAAAGVSAGHSITGAYTGWLPVGGPGLESTIAVAAYVTGTINYTMQHTFDNTFNSTETINIFNSDDTSVVNATTSKDSNYFAPPAAVRILINSGTGSLIYYVNQTGLTS